jgi:hypothetical protein
MRASREKDQSIDQARTVARHRIFARRGDFFLAA